MRRASHAPQGVGETEDALQVAGQRDPPECAESVQPTSTSFSLELCRSMKKDPNLNELHDDIAAFCRKQDKRSKTMEEAIDRSLGLWEEPNDDNEEGEWL